MTRRGVAHAPVAAIVVLLVAAGGYLTWLASRIWFLLDDWAFLLHREVTLTGDDSLLQPHNDHWSTVPILVFRLLFNTVGLHHLPYAVLNIGLHLTVCALLVLVLWRAGASPWVCVLMTGVSAFLGPGALDILWDFQMGFLAPTAMAFGAIVLVDRREQMSRYPVGVWLLLVGAVMCSGTGVTMVAFVAAYTWLRRSFREAVVVGLLPAVVYVTWFLAYGLGASPAPSAQAGRIVPFVFEGMKVLWDTMLPVPGLGVVVLIAVTVATIRARNQARLRAFAAAGLLALVVNYLLLAIARAGLGVITATSTRYLYVGLVLTLPAVALTLQLGWERLERHPWPRALFAAALGVLLVVSGAGKFYNAGDTMAGWTAGLRDRVVASAQIVGEGQRVLTQHPEQEVAPDIDADSLGRTTVQDKIPKVDPPKQAALDAASHLQVAESDESLELPAAAAVQLDGFEVASQAGSCADLDATSGATIDLPATANGSEVTLTVSGPRIKTELRRGDRRSVRSTHKVPADEAFHVGTVAPDAMLRITVPSGPVTVCGPGTLSPRG